MPEQQEALPCARCQPLEALIRDYEQNMVELGQKVAQLEDELAGRERQLRREGATVVALQRALRDVQEEEAGADEVRHLLGVWMRCTGRDKRKGGRKADVSVSSKRGQYVAKALRMKNVQTGERYTIEDLTLAFEGLGLYPFVGPKGRSMTGEKRYDEVEHALRDEPTIDRFIGYARNFQNAAQAEDDRAFERWQRVQAQERLMASELLTALSRRVKQHNGHKLEEAA